MGKITQLSRRPKRPLSEAEPQGTQAGFSLADISWGVPQSVAAAIVTGGLIGWLLFELLPDPAPALPAAAGPADVETAVPHTPVAGDCIIKGNVSIRGERIYHVPGGEFYDATGVNPAKGERWFCSEAEAIAAGWRPSKR